MPWPSELTAQLAMSAGQMHQSMWSNYGGGGGGFGPQGMGMMSDSVMGSAASRMGASGGPMLQGAMGMAGLDPFSMGIRGAMGAWRGGAGLMGAGMMGMGMMGATAGVGAVASWAGNQMMQGAQNQQGFNQGMRQNFSFMNSQGGQGFTRSELSGISGNLQSMTHEYGPGGEVNTFGELSRLAQNMGKMGMTQGVRNAQDFSKKFKEMVSTLKTVATELGTSLESAQELLASSRGSGIFKTADQLKYGATLRSTGLAGGLATSEMTAMGNIGSQIARSVGGLGRQGAMGGIKALGQIGTATQIGAMSEEDIYNATGLTGAEGRQAMATGMMQNSGNFMKSSRGRFFLASIAQKDGKLDMDAVSQYMNGGMSVNETRDRAHQNLAGVGRANFIRNEGRLRGAAMEQFGALAPALALQGWLQGKGIDTESDRGMLAVQRYLGVGRDEADDTMKMVRNLPQIMQEQRRVAGSDEFMQSKAQHMKQRDIRTRIDQMKEGIQGKVQKWGADLFQSGSQWLEGVANRMLDNYETQMNEDVDKITYNTRFGGAGATTAFRGLVGTAASMKAGRAAAEKLGLTGAGGFSGGTNTGMQQYARGALAEADAASPEGRARAAAPVAALDRYRSAGPGLKAGDFFSGQGGYRSIAEANRALGASMLGGRTDKEYLNDAGTGRQMLGMLSMGVSAASRLGQYLAEGTGSGARGSIFKDAFEDSKDFIRRGSGVATQDQARGDFLRSKAGRKLIGGMSTGDDAEAMSRMKELQGTEYAKLTDQDKGTLQALQMAHMGVEYNRIQSDSGMSASDKASKTQALIDQAKNSDAIRGVMKTVGEGDLKQWGTTAAAAQYLNQRDNALGIASKMGKQGIDELASMVRTGRISKDKGGKYQLTADSKKGLSADGSQAMELALEITKDQANLVNITDEDARLAAISGTGAAGPRNDILAKQDALASKLGNMSTADKLKFAKMASGSAQDLAYDLAGADKSVKDTMKATGGNATAAMARMMGLHMDKGAEKGLTEADLAEKLGMGGNADFKKTLQDALGAMKGGKANAGQLMEQALGSLSDEARMKIKAQNEGEADPLQKKIADNSDKSTVALVEIAKKIGVSNDALQKLASSNDNSEKTGT